MLQIIKKPLLIVIPLLFLSIQAFSEGPSCMQALSSPNDLLLPRTIDTIHIDLSRLLEISMKYRGLSPAEYYRAAVERAGEHIDLALKERPSALRLYFSETARQEAAQIREARLQVILNEHRADFLYDYAEKMRTSFFEIVKKFFNSIAALEEYTRVPSNIQVEGLTIENLTPGKVDSLARQLEKWEHKLQTEPPKIPEPTLAYTRELYESLKNEPSLEDVFAPFEEYRIPNAFWRRPFTSQEYDQAVTVKNKRLGLAIFDKIVLWSGSSFTLRPFKNLPGAKSYIDYLDHMVGQYIFYYSQMTAQFAKIAGIQDSEVKVHMGRLIDYHIVSNGIQYRVLTPDGKLVDEFHAFYSATETTFYTRRINEFNPVHQEQYIGKQVRLHLIVARADGKGYDKSQPIKGKVLSIQNGKIMVEKKNGQKVQIVCPPLRAFKVWLKAEILP